MATAARRSSKIGAGLYATPSLNLTEGYISPNY